MVYASIYFCKYQFSLCLLTFLKTSELEIIISVTENVLGFRSIGKATVESPD